VLAVALSFSFAQFVGGMPGARALEQMAAAQVARKCAAHRFNALLTHRAGTLERYEQGKRGSKQLHRGQSQLGLKAARALWSICDAVNMQTVAIKWLPRSWICIKIELHACGSSSVAVVGSAYGSRWA